MDRLNALAPRQLLLGAGVLLLIDTFLPWQSVSDLSAQRLARLLRRAHVPRASLVLTRPRRGEDVRGRTSARDPVRARDARARRSAILLCACSRTSRTTSRPGARTSASCVAAFVALGSWRVFGETAREPALLFTPAPERPVPTASVATPVDGPDRHRVLIARRRGAVARRRPSGGPLPAGTPRNRSCSSSPERPAPSACSPPWRSCIAASPCDLSTPNPAAVTQSPGVQTVLACGEHRSAALPQPAARPSARAGGVGSPDEQPRRRGRPRRAPDRPLDEGRR